VHRLQIGFVGLAGVLLVVGLANIIMTRAQQGDAAAAGAAAGPMVASDPMVAAGVAPAASPAAEKRPAKSGR
jgi:cyanophycinase-like exopeptidase